MKIIVNRQAFANALNDVAPFIPAKPAVIILRNARITTKGNRMKIEANNAQDSITRYIDVVECDGDGSFLVNMAEFGKFISALKDTAIQMTVRDGEINVKHSKGSADFATESANEFPDTAKASENSTRIMMDPKTLADCIENGAPFVSTETIRPIMCAIYASISGNIFSYCASDTHKLITGESTLDKDYEDVSFFIMPTAFKSLLRMCRLSNAVMIHVSETIVEYRTEDTVLCTVQAKGRYPAFKRVIPQSSTLECAIDRDEFADSIRRVSMFSDVSRCLKLCVGNMDATISADNLTRMNKSSETVMHSGCNGEIKIGLNADHAQTILAMLDKGNMDMKFVDTSKPILFTQESKPGITALLMPMQIVNQ